MLLSSFISFSPIATIIACNKKDEIIDEGSNIDKTVELFNTIKTKISNELSNSEKTKIYLDAKDLNMKDEDIKQILNPIFEEANNDLKKEVLVSNNEISEKISERISIIVNDLNTQLKEIPALENNNKTISLNSIAARMNGNDIKTLVDLIDQKQSAPTPGNNFDYNLQLNLNFKINVNNKEDNYIYNPKSAFITSDKEGLTRKIVDLADKLSEKLANQELDSKKIIDNVLNGNIDSYQQSFSNELNTILKEKNIKIEKSENMEINREELSFSLNLLKIRSTSVKFLKYINDEENVMTTVEDLFINKNHEFYQFKDYKNISGNKIYTKNYLNFILRKWSIEGIELPKRSLKDIKIYHKINEIENSWKNFYILLKQYFNQNNWLQGRNGFFHGIILHKDFITLQKTKDLTFVQLFEKWNKYIQSKISNNEILTNFVNKIIIKNNLINQKVDIRESYMKKYIEEFFPEYYCDGIENSGDNNNFTFQLFFNQFNLLRKSHSFSLNFCIFK